MYAKVTGMRTGEERVQALRTLLRTQDTPIHGCRLAYTNGREPPWGVGTQAKGYSKVPPPGYPPGSPGGIALSKWGPVWRGPVKRVPSTTPEGTPAVHAPKPLSPNRVYRLGDTPLGVTRLRL